LGTPGTDPNGMHESTLGRHNYVNWSYINFYKLCFAAWRGSVRYKVIPQVAAGNGNITFVGHLTSSIRVPNNFTLNNTFNYSFMSKNCTRIFRDAGRGAAISDSGTKRMIEAEIPYYRNRRFSSGFRTNQNADVTESMTLAYSLTTNGSVGADTQLGFHFY
jgi:hypothetical protein